MKILHIYREKNQGQIGGVEYHVKYLIQEQIQQGLVPCVLTFMLSDKDHLDIKKQDGVDWYYMEVKSSFHQLSKWLKSFEAGKLGLLITSFERIRQNFRLKKKIELIMLINPDIVHQHDYLSSVRLSRKIAENFRIIFTNHYGEYLFLSKTRLTRYFQAYFLNHFESIIAPSYNLLPTKGNCHFIPNGVDTKLFNKVLPIKKQEFKVEQGLQGKVVFLCARRWAPTKGIIFLARALNLLSDEIKQKSVFLFAGNDAEDFQLYKKQVHTELNKCTGVEIRLCGNLNHIELTSLISATDIGIIPSLMEGMSLFSIELISSGVPVLATNVGGLPQVVKMNENGWLFPPKDAQSLAREITRIVANWPDTDLEIDTFEFRDRYSWKSIAKQTLEIYNQ